MVVYSNSLDGGVVLDDTIAIRLNPDMEATTPWTEIFKHDFWYVCACPLTHLARGSTPCNIALIGSILLCVRVCAVRGCRGTPFEHEDSHKSYRPLTTLSFRWNYQLHGLDTYWYAPKVFVFVCGCWGGGDGGSSDRGRGVEPLEWACEGWA